MHNQQQPQLARSFMIKVPKTPLSSNKSSPNKKSKGIMSVISPIYKCGQQSSKKELQRKVIVLRRHKKNKQSIFKPENRTVKLNLTSSRRNQNNTTNQESLKHQDQRFYVQSKQSQYISQKNHISVTGGFVCDIFQCNGAEGVDEWQRQPLSSSQNLFGESNKSRQIVTFKIKSSSQKENQRKKSQSFNESLGPFSKRKNIFDSSAILNTTIDGFSFERPERSKSRRGIFMKKETTVQKDKSTDPIASTIKKVIDCPLIQYSPSFGVKVHEQFLEDSDIPKFILDSWEKFTESSVLESESNSLEVVSEACLEESQVA